MQRDQMDLFSMQKSNVEQRLDNQETQSGPLAFEARPKQFQHFIGQKKALEQLGTGELRSLIIWGPPGCGKTTLAHLLCQRASIELFSFNAVLAGLPELKKLIQQVQENQLRLGKKCAIFIDEIHRFNKAQQDALLPYVEEGTFILLGATTENPRSAINQALLSRLRSIALTTLLPDDLLTILKNACNKIDTDVSEEILLFLAQHSSGDARKALNNLELLLPWINKSTDFSKLKEIILENARIYDKGGNRHYDVISAFIKSLRGSDPQAALLWLAVMIDGGEDPVFIARRLVIFASEDIGNADPSAVTLAMTALQVVQNIGMPEARITLGQAVTYLASTYKSNSSYKAIDEALAYVRNSDTQLVPNHLKNYPPPGSKTYLYPHDYPGHWVKQNYTEEKCPTFYKPSDEGKEKFLKERLEKLERD